MLPVCGDLLCLFGRFGGLHVLDPATGRQRWAADEWRSAQRVGRYLIANRSDIPDQPDPLYVLDVATGALHGRLGSWETIGAPLPGLVR